MKKILLLSLFVACTLPVLVGCCDTDRHETSSTTATYEPVDNKDMHPVHQ